MGLFSTKKMEERPGAPEEPVAQAPRAKAAAPAAAPAEPVRGTARVGIEHAIQLLRSLPTEKNVELVVTVLKTTLESLGIRVADIIADAVHRQKDIETQVTRLKGEITALEKEVALRVAEIAKLEAQHAETTKVRDYLEREEIDLVQDEEARPTI